jgi:hypothetical protein
MDMHPLLLPSPLELLLIGARSRTSLLRASRSSFTCVDPTMPLSTSLTHRRVIGLLSLRKVSVRCTPPWVLRTPSPRSTLLFLLPLWKTLGLGTATSMMMMKTMMKLRMRSKRSSSEDLSFLLSFLVFDAKGGEGVLYLASYSCL